MRKAQAAIEITIIASVMLIVLLFLFEFGETKILENASVVQVSEARNTVDMLAKAAIEVHNEGVGAKRKVYITIPDRVDPNRVLINNNTITLGVYVGDGTSDISSEVNFQVRKGGYFPTTPGNYWLWVISKEGYVQIGSTLGIEPMSAYLEMLPSDSTTMNIKFTNYGTSPVNVSLQVDWPYTEIDATMDDVASLSFSLQPGTSNAEDVELRATSYANASRGLYNGYVSVTTNVTESEFLPVVVNIVAQSSAAVSYLTIGTYNDTVYTNTDVLFSPTDVLYYKVRSYNSTDELVNSTVTVRIYDPSSILVHQQTYSPNAGTGVYTGSYTILYSLPGLWKITAYEIGGASTSAYFTTLPYY